LRRAEACPEEVPLDNARELILGHAAASREVVVNPKLHPFARHWSFQVRARARNRPRTEISSLPATSAGAIHFVLMPLVD
jgi:transposase